MELLDKLKEIKEKYDGINEQLSDPEIVSNQEKLIELSKKRSELTELVDAYNNLMDVMKNIEENKEIISSSDDDELKEMAEAELGELEGKKIKLEDDIKTLLIPKDPDDDKNVIMEIRAGTGGDEAGIFANDLYRMYSRFAELKGWRQEIIDANESTMGGIKEIVLGLSGKGVYGDLKFESGVHRVQRVPVTEASGRLHTSAASVVVMPSRRLRNWNRSKRSAD